MEPLLGSPALPSLAAADVLLAFDFDGMLAPIVADPSAAAMRPATRRLLASVAGLSAPRLTRAEPRPPTLRRIGGLVCPRRTPF